MVIDIRGTHGSGKSWLMHQLISYGADEVTGTCHYTHKDKVLGYVLPDWDAFILGKYSNVCGGCDQIGSADEVVRRIREFSEQYTHIILEGILVAHTYQRYADLAVEMQDYGYIFCFLDTPLETCIERVKQRRANAGNDKPLNPANIIKDYRNIWTTVRHKVYAAGLNAIDVPHTDPLGPIIDLLDKVTTFE